MKKYIKLLFLGLIFTLNWIFNFWYCSTVEDLIQVFDSSNDYTISTNYQVLYHLNSADYWVYCIKANRISWWIYFNFWYSYSQNLVNAWDYMTVYLTPNSPHIACFYINQPYIWVWLLWYDPSSVELDMSYELFRLDELLAESLPIMTKWECQAEYNLIPIEEIDINYCVGNWLCPSEMWSWDYTWDLQYSNLYINDILHPWKQNIFVNIPDYIQWDYSVSDDDFNLYVWSGYDLDYIESVIDINSYRPTSEDFTNVFVSGLTLVMPYIVIALFIIFVRKLIKRIFK